MQAADGSKVLLRVNGELGVRLTKELVSDLEQLVGAENMMLAGEGQRRMKRIAQQQLFKDAAPVAEKPLEAPSDEVEMELAGDVLLYRVFCERRAALLWLFCGWVFNPCARVKNPCHECTPLYFVASLWPASALASGVSISQPPPRALNNATALAETCVSLSTSASCDS